MMKKTLLFVLILTLITISVNSQIGKYWNTVTDYYNDPPVYMRFDEIIDKYCDGEFHANNNILMKYMKKYYSFVMDGKLYVLSYEPLESYDWKFIARQWQQGDAFIRNIYIYRRDGKHKWSKVSDVIKTDSLYKEYVKFNGNKTQKNHRKLYYPLTNGYGLDYMKGYITQYIDRGEKYIRIRLTTYNTWFLGSISNDHLIGTMIINLKLTNYGHYNIVNKYIEY